MTETPVAEAAPVAAPVETSTPATPAARPEPVATPDPAAPSETPAPVNGEQPSFKVPDAYKDKPWASKIKNEEDLYKQLDNLDQAIGKKSVMPDPKTAKPEEMDAYFAKLRPTDKAAYKFGEGVDPTFTGGVADILFESGISEYQAQKLIPAYQALEQKNLEAATSSDGFKETMTNRFGEKYDATVNAITQEHKKFVSKADQQVMETMPNEYLGVVYNVTKHYQDQIASLKKEYGVSENGDAHLRGNGPIPAENLVEARNKIRGDLATMDNRPHTQQEKQVLLDKLDATYRNEKRK